jgi:cell wall-associated NlpC family hydrolase
VKGEEKMKHGKRVLSLLLAVLLVAVIAPSAWAVSLTGTQVAEYCRSLEGGSYPSGYCLSFVADCFADLGAARDSACCAYTYGSSHITSTSMSNIPLGADVFFTGSGSTCSRCGNRCGHIGIYVGDGYMIHAMSGKVRLDLVTTIDSYSSLAFRGWGYHGNVTITGGEPTPRDQDARFNGLLPLKTYALSGSGQIPVYTSAGIQESGRWIDAAADECIIQAVYTDGWCQVQYPSSASASGYRTA